MSITDFVKWLKGLGVTTEAYPLALPTTADDEAIVIHTGSGPSIGGDVQEVILTVQTRAKHPERSEQIAIDVYSLLNKLTNENIGNVQVIVVRPQERLPQFLGKDETYFYFENNYTVLVSG